MIKKMTVLAISASLLLSSAGCGGKEEESLGEAEKYVNAARTAFNDALDLTSYTAVSSALNVQEIFLEAENAELSGNVGVTTPQYPGYTGESYVSGFSVEGKDKCTFTAEIEESGLYDLVFNSGMGNGDQRSNLVFVDGEQVGEVITEAIESFSEYSLQSVYLKEGTRKISVGVSWGYINLDNLRIKPSSALSDDTYRVSRTLSNASSSEQTQVLMNFLCDAYGKYIISGQYCQDGFSGTEIRKITDKTGKTPAMLGLDLIDYSPSRVEFGGESDYVIDKAMDWWYVRGGIVTLCWHWNAPSKYVINSAAQPWYKAFYKEAATIDLDKIMNGEDEDGYQLLMQDIDAIAEQLKRLDKAKVPILWRPLHEASGGWFWWGDCSPESYKKLWNILYDKMTNEHKLNNLIWVWNGQSKDWYPGDSTVDIVGWDIYAGEHVYTSQSGRFAEMTQIAAENKILALTENGTMFDPDLAFRDDARWAWFCTWSGEFVVKMTLPTEDYTEFSMWEKVYNHEKVLTLDEMPDLRNYNSSAQ